MVARRKYQRGIGTIEARRIGDGSRRRGESVAAALGGSKFLAAADARAPRRAAFSNL